MLSNNEGLTLHHQSTKIFKNPTTNVSSRPSKGGAYEAKWWYAFRHRGGAEVGRILYEELYFNTKDPEFSLLGAYFLFTAGKYHSKKDWVKVESLLQQYWQHVLARKYCFLAGGL